MKSSFFIDNNSNDYFMAIYLISVGKMLKCSKKLGTFLGKLQKDLPAIHKVKKREYNVL